MTNVLSCIAGEFTGYAHGNIFRFDNGLVCQQVTSRYAYLYAYRPAARLIQQHGRLLLEVEGMGEAVQVVRVSKLEEGVIVNDFRGFTGDSLFHFDNGHVWQQAEYKYNYHYAYRPDAVIVDGINGPEMHVDGMDETVGVRRVR